MTLAERVLNARKHQKAVTEPRQRQHSVSGISENIAKVISEREHLEHAMEDIQSRKKQAIRALSSDESDASYFRNTPVVSNVSSSPKKSQTNETANRSGIGIVVLNAPSEFRNFAWRRWTARQIDWILGYCFLYVVMVALSYSSGATGVGLGFWKWIARPENAWMDLIITTSVAFFADALVYAIFKNTLGKKICGISVCDKTGHLISSIDYLKRDFRVLIGGYWIFILSIIPFIQQYNRVKVGGATSYDHGYEYQARPTREKTWFDTILIVVVFVLAGVIRILTN